MNDNEDDALWAHVTKDVEPLNKGAEKRTQIKSKSQSDVKEEKSTSAKRKVKSWQVLELASQKLTEISKKSQGQEVDGRTSRRLKQGKIVVEGHIDLHGMTQEQAHNALNGFIQKSYLQGKRCVLVITGKGDRQYHHHERATHFIDPEPGVLKRRVPEWLKDTSNSSMVLKTERARPSDGGDGALYVLLRRHRAK